ncbi:MAG: DegV family EDD domain-containing protein [Lachnospiraceae bacterium]|nr:DegV family EDD domain-containing protein [Lachnospiraceae bacterium]
MRLYKRLIERLADFTRSYEERTYIMLSILGVSAMIIALIFDIIGGENIVENITIMGAIIFIPVVVFITVRIRKVEIGSVISVCALIFVILPVIFFFGGGTRGGGVYWIIFSYMFIGMSLSGRLRVVMMTILTCIAGFEFWAEYNHNEWIYPHTIKMASLDSLVSVLLVGICMYIMLMYQKSIFTGESKRAHAEAKRAEELNRSQNRFFSNMSHEIRTPINSILGLNELILRDQTASDDIVRDASGIQGSGKMLLALINDILDFSKIEAGSMEIVPVDYHVGDMLSEIVNMIWIKAHDKGLKLEVSVDPEVPSVLYGDEVRIKQMVINLLNNAVKYTDEGRVGLNVECDKGDDNNVDLRISVSDTGMGIRKEDLPYLFDAFKRVDENKNRHIEGTGLGLSIVKQLAELMNGTVAVNSVYGEGTTFTITIKQVVSDSRKVGDLNIHNQQIVRRGSYESSFLAPEARILIVDDNEINLEVEQRLLKDTDMGIDTALNGKEALEMCLKNHYDAILMDHLMPEMDGVKCLEALRNQVGGLNRNTPVIVLTANAGSENRDLYTRSGFDGYLVKPVSGEALEAVLVRHISSDKIITRSVMMGNSEEIRTSEKYTDKVPIIITASSMCDIPNFLIRKLNIPVISAMIKTREGRFKDGRHMDANELIRYIGRGGEAVSSAADESDYTEFFADVLKKAHHVIHISVLTAMSRDYLTACEAAKSFDNVTVINSETISSAACLLVLIGYKLIQQGMPVEDIINELESVKRYLRCSFVFNTTEYMARKGYVSKWFSRVAQTLNLHPAIRVKNDKAKTRGLWIGRSKRAYRKYIGWALPREAKPDKELAFVTYVDIPADTLDWIGRQIKKTADFEHIIFKQASASVSSNCGPGTFGILYFLKTDKSYNLASFLDQEDDDTEDTAEDEVINKGVYRSVKKEDTYVKADIPLPLPEKKWYSDLDFVDAGIGIKNSGSEESFEEVLRIYCSSIADRATELEMFYTAGDFKNYTIKIHALKSSSRLAGIPELGDRAEQLEAAGKEDNIDYIREHHEGFLEDYRKYGKAIAGALEEKAAAEEKKRPDKPEADPFLIETVYEYLLEGARAMNLSAIEDVMEEIAPYKIPVSDSERFARIREKIDKLDYDGIIETITEGHA